MNRPEILQTAEKCVCSDREQEYGTPEENFQIIADFWNIYLNKKIIEEAINILPEDVSNMMMLLKIARLTSGKSKDDTFIDIAGYASISGELATLQRPDYKEFRSFLSDLQFKNR